MTNSREINFATWVSRLIRWALAAVLAYIAYSFEDAKILYIFAGVAFISGFFAPKRCIDDNCNIPPREP